MKRELAWLDRVIFAFAAFFFIAPLIAAAEYSVRGYGNKGHTFANYSWIIHQLGFSAALPKVSAIFCSTSSNLGPAPIE